MMSPIQKQIHIQYFDKSESLDIQIFFVIYTARCIQRYENAKGYN